ncbi:MAG: PilZ domain-containing protein [Desulfobulbaceae bacterium]|nr:PilZ domain-containing protein [Desulfobulbaceae bacterium]
MEEDRRKKPRSNSLNLLDYIIVDEEGKSGSYSMGRTLNISDDGILMETNIELELGQLVLITLDLEEELVQVTGKIIHVGGNTGAYQAGIKFFHLGNNERRAIAVYTKLFNKHNDPDKQEES